MVASVIATNVYCSKTKDLGTIKPDIFVGDAELSVLK